MNNTAEHFEKEKNKAMNYAQYHGYGKLCVSSIKRAKSESEIENCMELGRERKEAVEAAKDLCYPSEVRNAIWKAKTSDKITNIMIDARKGVFKTA